MDCRNAVRAVRTDNGQVGHSDLPFRTLLDQAHAFHAALVPGETLADVLQESPVDFVNDLQLPRHQDFKPFHRPLLQSFRQQRVIGICQCPPGQAPCVVPAQVSVIQQNSHQFGDRDGRMCVIHLYRYLLGQPVPIVVQPPEPAYDIRHRTGDQEVFLHEPQTAAHGGRVIRVQHAGKRFRFQRLAQSSDEVSAPELLKIEIVRRRRGPQPQSVDRLPAVAHHGTIEGNAVQARWPVQVSLQIDRL